jgi:NADH-quinone oxidoreductase subunit G
MVAAVPHLAAIDVVPENEWQAVTSEKMAQGDFGQAISDYYLSNPIARASALMAELSANAKVRNSAPLAAE